MIYKFTEVLNDLIDYLVSYFQWQGLKTIPIQSYLIFPAIHWNC